MIPRLFDLTLAYLLMLAVYKLFTLLEARHSFRSDLGSVDDFEEFLGWCEAAVKVQPAVLPDRLEQ